MIKLDTLSMDDKSPIYMQMVVFIKREILAKRILDGDELPSRRMVSATLGVNPNTVQKAYKILEDEGICISRSGAKSQISIDEGNLNKIRKELLEEELRIMVENLKHSGISLSETVQILKELWEEKP